MESHLKHFITPIDALDMAKAVLRLWSCGYRRDSRSEGREFESQHHMLDGIFHIVLL